MQFKSKRATAGPLQGDECTHDALIKHGIPLKPRVDAVVNKIDFQIKLVVIKNELKFSDYEIFRKAMSSVKENNAEHMRVHLSDCRQIRDIKGGDSVENSKYCRFSIILKSHDCGCEKHSVFSNPIHT